MKQIPVNKGKEIVVSAGHGVAPSCLITSSATCCECLVNDPLGETVSEVRGNAPDDVIKYINKPCKYLIWSVQAYLTLTQPCKEALRLKANQNSKQRYGL